MGQNHSNHTSQRRLTTSSTSRPDQHQEERFYDLQEFPPEIAVEILSNLNATDLCLATCVWKDLAENEILWKRLCSSKWEYTTLYNRLRSPNFSWESRKKPLFKHLYLLLDEATLIFGFRPQQGIKYLVDHNILDNTIEEIAKFIHGTSSLSSKSLQVYLNDRHDILDLLIEMMTFKGLSICDGLRKFFKKIHPPQQRGNFLDIAVQKFASRYLKCNPGSGFNEENIAVLCYSLLLLSVDLYSPHVKNKMSKREFIRNNYQVLEGSVSRESLGDIYDDVYLNGHIVVNSISMKKNGRKPPCFPFYRPYGAIFEFKPIELKLLSCNC